MTRKYVKSLEHIYVYVVFHETPEKIDIHFHIGYISISG